MGAIWDNVRKEHSIVINGSNVGKINANSQITLSPSNAAGIETTLNQLYQFNSKKMNRKVTFHIFDKVKGEYAMCIHDSSIKLDDKWWEPSKE